MYIEKGGWTMKDKAYWLALAERYFEAETTREEEAMLKRFLATHMAEDEAFDELKAVMGYLTVGRKLSQQPSAKPKGVKTGWWVAAAAVALLLILPLTRQLQVNEDVCVAYVGGQKVSDSREVMMLMRQSMQNVQHESPEPTIETQLNEIFNTLK